MMRFLKYCAVPWAAVLFYAGASFFAGQTGLSAYTKLNNERKKQIENISALRKINDALIAEREALSYDAETIAREAVNIGYGRDGEMYIRIDGFNDTRRNELKAGAVMRPEEPAAIDDEVLKIYAIGIFIIALGAAGIFDILRFIRSA